MEELRKLDWAQRELELPFNLNIMSADPSENYVAEIVPFGSLNGDQMNRPSVPGCRMPLGKSTIFGKAVS
jgi:hypothetical protein